MARNISYFLVLDEKFMKETLKNPFDLKEDDKINLVHIFEKQTYFDELSAYNYPPQSEEETITKSVLEILKAQGEKLKSKSKLPNLTVECHCIFSHNPKETAVEFLEKSQSQIAVIATKEKGKLSGIFTSSFTDYLCRHCKADIYVTRHHEN